MEDGKKTPPLNREGWETLAVRLLGTRGTLRVQKASHLTAHRRGADIPVFSFWREGMQPRLSQTEALSKNLDLEGLTQRCGGELRKVLECFSIYPQEMKVDVAKFPSMSKFKFSTISSILP